jgi:hypothetical protein
MRTGPVQASNRKDCGSLVARPAHRSRRVHRHHLAGDQPVEQVPPGGEEFQKAKAGAIARGGDQGGAQSGVAGSAAEDASHGEYELLGL